MATYQLMVEMALKWVRGMKWPAAALPAGLTLCLAWPACAQSVAFINPGKSNEAYWRAASEAMHKAANSLGMQLTVYYGERERLEPINIAQRLVALPAQQRPDYVIFSNEYNVAPSILQHFEAAGIKSFMAFSGRQADAVDQLGKPRERFKNWLGSLMPNAEDAGYLTAKALIDAASQRPELKSAQGGVQMIAIAGDRSTPSSTARNRGLHKAVRESQGKVQLMQMVYADWREDKAQHQAKVLFQRYPQARLVWAGNDLMAFGAMQAWADTGGRPGGDAVFSGINTSAKAFDSLRKGTLSALAGGHFLAGAWAMVMIYDYHHGIDFVEEGLELQRNMFILFDKKSSVDFEKHFGHASVPLNFKIFSKSINPSIKEYDFDVKRLLGEK